MRHFGAVLPANRRGLRQTAVKPCQRGAGGARRPLVKLHRRIGDPIWLERACEFAMTAIAQCRAERALLGRGRFSLWTGDVGLAIYLRDCITADPRFPTVDVF